MEPTARPRSRGRLVLAAAAVVAAIAVTALVADRPPDRRATTVTPPAASTAPLAGAPACPPALPALDGPAAKGSMVVRAGRQLTLTARIRDLGPDRPLLSFTVYLLPRGADMNERGSAVAQSPELRLASGQRQVSPVLRIPAGLASGTYHILGYATFPGPSLCGVTNPPDSTQVGATWGFLGSVVVD